MRALLAKLSVVAVLAACDAVPAPVPTPAPTPEVQGPGPAGCNPTEGDSFYRVTCNAGNGAYQARISCISGTPEQGEWVGIHGTSRAYCWGGIKLNGWTDFSLYL